MGILRPRALPLGKLADWYEQVFGEDSLNEAENDAKEAPCPGPEPKRAKEAPCPGPEPKRAKPAPKTQARRRHAQAKSAGKATPCPGQEPNDMLPLVVLLARTLDGRSFVIDSDSESESEESEPDDSEMPDISELWSSSGMASIFDVDA